MLDSPESAPSPSSISESTVDPELDEAWGDLPEIPMEDAVEVEEVEGAVETQGGRAVPALVQRRDAAATIDLPTIELPDALWQAGLLNGHPAHLEDEVLPGEYGPDRPEESVLHIRDPAEFPAFLYPNQQIILYLPGFPQSLYTVQVATTGGNRKEREMLKNRDQRLLAVRWNDHLIWQRWRDPFHSVSSSVVPPHKVDPDSNRVILENWGTRPLPLDAVWLSPYSRGEYPFYVAMERAEWLNREESKWIRSVVPELSPPLKELDLSSLPERVPKPPPTSPSELRRRWREAGERYHRLLEADPSAAEALRPWMIAFSKAVSRGMLPSVTLRPPEDPDSPRDLAAALYVFGDLVPTWYLSGRSPDRDWAEQLKTLAPDAKVVSPARSQTTDDAPWLRFQNASYDFHQQFYQGRQRSAFFAGEISASELEERSRFLLNSKANFHGYMWKSQCFHSYVFHRWVTQNLMANDYPVVVHGGHPGGPFFPAGDDTPGLMWHYLKTLFRFGGPEYRKGLANLRGVDNSPEILDSSWAVADNGRDSVQVLVNSQRLLHGREAILELPLPWEGPTRMLHHQTTSHWGRPPKTPPKTTTARRQIEGESIPMDASGTPGSWVRVQFEFQGHHLFEFRREGSSDGRELSAPDTVGFSELREAETLFDASTSPPPPWWSRKTMGSHFSANWRPSGDVEVNPDVPATRDQARDWAPFKNFHRAMEADFEAVSPLRDTSTRFRFGAKDPDFAQVVRVNYRRGVTHDSDRMGLWIRAEPPPGFEAPFDWYRTMPTTSVYMGKLPVRQRIELEYGRWTFVSSPIHYWRESVSRHSPFLMFWPTHPEGGNPIIEVNSFEAYGQNLEEGELSSERCLGFIQERTPGTFQLLIIGVPGKPAFWRQRLSHLIDPDRLKHVIDRELLTTADRTEDDPPERVRHAISVFADSKLLEVQVDTMPGPPSPSHLRRIRKDFPLVVDKLQSQELSAILFEFDETSSP